MLIKIVIAVCVISFSFFFYSCSSENTSEPANHPPEIISLSANPDVVGPSGSVVLICEATDPDGDNLEYVWEASSGSIGGSGDSVTWHAPDSTGIFTINCKVLDGHGGEDNSQTVIEVEFQIPTEGLVAWWPFNGNANDESGNGNDGIVHGNTVQFITGLFDQCIKFDNCNSSTFTVNDYVELPKISINELTVSHWVKYLSGSSTSYDGCTYSIGGYPTKLFNVRIKNTGMLLGQFIINNTYYNTNLVDISDKQWHLITVTVDSDYMRIYKDGSIVDSTGLQTVPEFIDDYQQVALHRFSGNRSSRFTGEMDNLRIYNRSLKPAEITQLFQEQR